MINQPQSRRREIIFVIRKKLTSGKPKTVSLAISLAEALVKNGGIRVHAAIATDAFMKDMCKVARRYSGRIGADNIEAAELALDVIQAWGEAFLSRQKQFPAFVKAYHDLRKEGMQFKAQYDVSRVPIFTPTTGGAGFDGEDSEILRAASIAASMDSGNRTTTNTRTNHNNSHHSSNKQYDRSANNNMRNNNPHISTGFPQERFVGRSNKGASGSAELLESMVTSLGILSEILTAATSAAELRENEIASEVAQQLRTLQGGLGAAIEYELSRDPEVKAY